MEELIRLEEQVVVIVDDVMDPFATGMAQLGGRIIEGPKRDVETLRAAGVEHAEALALTDSDDVGNVHAALAAQEIHPQLRLVVRMYNRRLTARIDVLFDHCTVLSPSALAAPAFVNAALGDGLGQIFRVSGRVLQVGTRELVRNPLLPLARTDGGNVALLPDSDEPHDLVLGQPLSDDDELANLPAMGAPWVESAPKAAAKAERRTRWRRIVGTIAAVFGPRLRLLLTVLVALAMAATCAFHFGWRLGWVDAIYRTVTVVTATGYDNLLGKPEVPASMKLFGGAIVLMGVFLLAMLTAIVVDDLIGARLGQRLGLAVGKPREHVVVCGLGRVGMRVVEHLAHAGISVVAIDRTPDAGRMARARRLGIAVVHGDASKEEILNSANVGTARCVVAVTNDDVTNLETGLATRALRPDMRVVLRLFDTDLANRVDHRLGLTISRSVSAVAAPVFATAMLGREILAVIPYGRRMLLLAELPVSEGSSAANAPLASLDRSGDTRVVAHHRGLSVTWQPAPDMELVAGDRVVVAATPTGLTHALRITGQALGR